MNNCIYMYICLHIYTYIYTMYIVVLSATIRLPISRICWCVNMYKYMYIYMNNCVYMYIYIYE